MEIKSLRYFLTAAREENMTRAASILHISQPTLSKTIKALEEELGKQLFIRHSFHIELTEEGMLLRKRAEDLVDLADKIENEFTALDILDGGDLYFGLAESYHIRYLARQIKLFKNMYPNLRFHITSGDSEQVIEKLNAGILDFAVLVEKPDSAIYDFMELPVKDSWVLVMPADDPLSKKEYIEPKDLVGLPLFCSEQSWQNDIPAWAGKYFESYKLEGSFRLSYNGGIFAMEGLGYLLTFDKLMNTDSGLLTSRPLYPPLENKMFLVWKKYQIFSPIASRFKEHMEKALHQG